MEKIVNNIYKRILNTAKMIKEDNLAISKQPIETVCGTNVDVNISHHSTVTELNEIIDICQTIIIINNG
jgi:hypothetical protein